MNIQLWCRVATSMLLAGLMSLSAGCITETTNPGGKADPAKSVQANVDLGLGYLSRGDLTRAKEKLDRALAFDDNSAIVHNAFGLLYQVDGDDKTAEQHFQKAIRIDPKLALARNTYGAFLYDKGRYREAIEQLQGAANDPFFRSRSSVYENLGVCYLKVADPDAAREAFQRAISINPGQARSLLELAELAYSKPDYVAARDLYGRFIAASEPTARSLWLGIRIARIFQNRNDEASYALMLRNIFPTSDEYRQYQDSVR